MRKLGGQRGKRREERWGRELFKARRGDEERTGRDKQKRRILLKLAS